MKILLVDDNKDILESMVPLLRRLGGEVCTASNGIEGLKLAEKNHYDVIITDYHMPQMNGCDMIDEIQKIDSGTKFIVTTAHPSGIDEKYKVFVKPLNTSKLKRYLKKEEKDTDG